MFCWHKYKDIKTQFTKRVCWGVGNTALPGCRLVQQCEKCGRTRYINLNLSMPNKYLYEEHLWRG